MPRAVIFDWGHTLMDEVEDIRAVESPRIHLMPGVKQVLPQIAIEMGIWANTRTATEAHVRSWLAKAEIGDYFTWVVTSADAGYRKPDSRFFSYALERCRLNKEEVLFVGNQLNTDIQGANDYGIKNVWLSGEAYRSADDTFRPGQIEPTYTIESLTELPTLIERLQEEGF